MAEARHQAQSIAKSAASSTDSTDCGHKSGAEGAGGSRVIDTASQTGADPPDRSTTSAGQGDRPLASPAPGRRTDFADSVAEFADRLATSADHGAPPLANLARRASDDREPAGGGPGAASDLDFDAGAGAAADSDGADLEGVVAASAAADSDGRNDLDKDGHKERQVVLVAFNFWLKIRILRLVCIEHCRLILWIIRRLLVRKRNSGEIEHLGR
jgi:hypothetical protein